MENDIRQKVNRLNELYAKTKTGMQLSPEELTEQAYLRDEIINYYKNVLNSYKMNA